MIDHSWLVDEALFFLFFFQEWEDARLFGARLTFFLLDKNWELRNGKGEGRCYLFLEKVERYKGEREGRTIIFV